MDFNLFFEILIALSILVVLVGIASVKRNMNYLKNANGVGANKLNVALKLAKQRKEALVDKEILVESINSKLFLNMFKVLKHLLVLQKLLIEKQL